jgi:hypothetical protein
MGPLGSAEERSRAGRLNEDLTSGELESSGTRVRGCREVNAEGYEPECGREVVILGPGFDVVLLVGDPGCDGEDEPSKRWAYTGMST